MKKSDLMKIIGKKVRVTFKDFSVYTGFLEYVPEFSCKYHYIKPGVFYIYGENVCFRVSHIRKIEVL